RAARAALETSSKDTWASALLPLGLRRVAEVVPRLELATRADARPRSGDERGVGLEPRLLDQLASRLEHALGVILDDLAALLEEHLEGRGEEDRGEGADRHAHEERERDVAQRARAEQEGSDEEDRADRQERHDRGVDRAHEGLVDGEVGHLAVGRAGLVGDAARVLPDLVEDRKSTRLNSSHVK